MQGYVGKDVIRLNLHYIALSIGLSSHFSESGCIIESDLEVTSNFGMTSSCITECILYNGASHQPGIWSPIGIIRRTVPT
ncbi:hypothetical protein EYR41_001006 [Orbilia oligospora]|uniref:Uncharacterized protein n=1 Tax=Orbilia oligospora TaxID=2813651 RepID=A0A8H2EAE9_ORBOL|nr:hypothetical protein EYR41_001006 [Orbilia oligospora]